MQTQPALKPRTIRLETPDYIVRSVEPSDVGPGWGDWLTDPQAALNLNARPARIQEQALRDYVEGFNRTTAHLLGIFERASGRLVGIRAVYVDPRRGEFLVNVLIGESDARGRGARTQSRDVVYRYFFEDMDLHAARANVLATNETVLAGMAKRGWIHEHTSRNAKADGQGVVDLHHFRLARDTWRSLDRERLAG